jgi:hypothetical protein
MTIYLPDDLAKEARKRAKKSGRSLSAFVAELLERQVRPRTWPRSFADLYGSCELAEIEDLQPDEPDKIDGR